VTAPATELRPTVTTMFNDAAARWGSRPFLVSAERRLTFQQVHDDAGPVAARLTKQGVRTGDRVLIAHADPVAAVVALFGALRCGAVCTVADPAAPPFVAGNVLSDLAPFTVLADPGSAYTARTGTPDRARTIPSPAEAALIIYTSGSTGRPKGIVASHGNVSFSAAAIQQRLALRSADRVACLLPLTFDYGLYQVFLALLSGCAVVFGSPGDLGGSLLSFLTREEITVVASVPTLSRMLLSLAARRGATRPPLRMLTNTGEAMSDALRQDIQAAFPGIEVYPMFGLTECKRVSILLPSEIDARPGSVGTPLTGTMCRILDEHGNSVAPNQIGQLAVTGPHVTLGYFNDPQLSGRTFRDSGTGTRTLLTGDKGWIDEQGYLFFAGRDDAVFKRKGYRVSITEIAFAAEQIEGVASAVCLPPASNRRNEIILVVTGSVALDSIHTGLAERLYPYQMPDRVEIVDSIPLTAHGKADTRTLVAKLADGSAGAGLTGSGAARDVTGAAVAGTPQRR
jgi:acyl-coenzyme A synthetase/AMP-(fatty) acid ligase